MPKRSTPFQAIVRLVRQHYAGSGVTITESKMLHDPVLGKSREVDIVIEGELDGEPMTISIEVIERGRPASIEWAEQQITKHRRLTTNRLILVSKSGFYSTALAAVEAEGGWVQALTPEYGDVDGESAVRRIYAAALTYKATGCRTHLLKPSGERIIAKPPAGTAVYSLEGGELGNLYDLVYETVNLESTQRDFLEDAQNHPDGSNLKGFNCHFAIGSLGYCLFEDELREMQLIGELEVWGDLNFGRREVPLTLGKLGHRQYSAGETTLGGRPVVFVGTADRAKGVTTLSWQTTDTSPAAAAAPTAPVARRFPELLQVFPSPDAPGLPSPALPSLTQPSDGTLPPDGRPAGHN